MAAHLPTVPDTGLALALAVVASSTAPLVLLDGDFKVLAASTSFFRVFQLKPAEAVDQPFFKLRSGEWDTPQLRALMKATATGIAEVDAYEMDLKGDRPRARRIVVDVHKLDYGDPHGVRLLLSAADVTDARDAEKIKDDLLREKTILLQEVQHRIANSLQIIASVILQSARKVLSPETRTYLTDAHNRVMSVATLQQQLAASRVGEVRLRDYFGQLADSISASMIPDGKELVLDTQVDDSAVSAEASVSLGLVVTELVINALKHAFPGGRSGRISVTHQSHGPNWTLSVRDDGVGMPKDAASATRGLGTNIVAALAAQLNARVDVADANPGTIVSLTHTPPVAAEAPSDRAELAN